MQQYFSLFVLSFIIALLVTYMFALATGVILQYASISADYKVLSGDDATLVLFCGRHNPLMVHLVKIYCM
jgi:hypothetical protein